MSIDEKGTVKVAIEVQGAPSVMVFGPGESLLCGNALGEVYVLDMDGKAHNIATVYKGKRFEPIAGIEFRTDGSLYFSTRARAESAGGGAPLGLYGVLPRLLPGGQDVDVVPPTLLIDKGSPVGIALSVGEKALYVSDSEYSRVMSYELDKKGVPSNPRIVSQYRPSKPGPLGALEVDAKGNVYCCCGDGIAVTNPDGEVLGVIPTPDAATGICWGGKEGKWLFVTTKSSLYRLQTKIGCKPN